MGIGVYSVHLLYVAFIAAIIVFMLLRKDTTFISLAGIFVIALWTTHSFSASVSSLFHSFTYAAGELLPTIFIICFIVAMSGLLTKTGINEAMISPFAKLMKGPAVAYWVIGCLMFAISLFFWPSPGVALIGAVLLPAAIRAGLSPIAAAMAMNLFGHGFALSGDYVIQAAPKLTADAAGIPVSDVMQASIPLVLIMGLTTTITAFFLIMRDRKKNEGPPLLGQLRFFGHKYVSAEKTQGDPGGFHSACFSRRYYLHDRIPPPRKRCDGTRRRNRDRHSPDHSFHCI